MKKKPGLAQVRLGNGSTRRVDRVLPGCCTSRSFNKPEPVQVPGLPSPGSTRQAGPNLITMPRTTRLGWPMLEKLFKIKVNKKLV